MYIISSVVVGLDPPHVKIKKASGLGISYLSVKYVIINENLDQVLKYSSTEVLKYLSTKPKLKY